MTTTPRALSDNIRNALDFLQSAGLILYQNDVALRESGRVTWHSASGLPFSYNPSAEATARLYLDWVIDGHYTAALPDGSLLQITYDVVGGEVVSHRLAYIPCPVVVDESMLWAGEPIAEVVDLFLADDVTLQSSLILRSPVRFDLDRGAAAAGHPAAHLTFNGVDCRIPCVAPMHPYRFFDFVYRHFYPRLRAQEEVWFAAAESRMLGDSLLVDDERRAPHVAWSLN